MSHECHTACCYWLVAWRYGTTHTPGAASDSGRTRAALPGGQGPSIHLRVPDSVSLLFLPRTRGGRSASENDKGRGGPSIMCCAPTTHGSQPTARAVACLLCGNGLMRTTRGAQGRRTEATTHSPFASYGVSQEGTYKRALAGKRIGSGCASFQAGSVVVSHTASGTFVHHMMSFAATWHASAGTAPSAAQADAPLAKR